MIDIAEGPGRDLKNIRQIGTPAEGDRPYPRKPGQKPAHFRESRRQKGGTDLPLFHSTSNNARSPDNGRSPRRSYLAEAVRLALLKSIHTVLACRNHTACGSLGGSVSLLLVFVIGLCWFTWYSHSIFAKQGIVKCDLRKTIYYFCYKFLL